MSLSPAVPRTAYHQRKIECHGYHREDGLWDIEGHMRDEKPYEFSNQDRGVIKVGDAIHDMWVRLTLDNKFILHAIEVKTDKSPFAICPQAENAYQALVGISVGPGFRKNVRERLATNQSCTHLTEILWTLATVAYQTIYASASQVRKDKGIPEKTQEEEIEALKNAKEKPRQLDSCHALSSTSPVVKRYWPQFYAGSE